MHRCCTLINRHPQNLHSFKARPNHWSSSIPFHMQSVSRRATSHWRYVKKSPWYDLCSWLGVKSQLSIREELTCILSSDCACLFVEVCVCVCVCVCERESNCCMCQIFRMYHGILYVDVTVPFTGLFFSFLFLFECGCFFIFFLMATCATI